MIVYVEQNIYNRLNERLKDMPEKIPRVMKRTINDTAKEARERIREEAREKYLIKEKGFNQAMHIEFATERYWNATIETKGDSIPLYDFRVRKNRGKTAAKAKVLTTSKLEELTLKGADNGKDLKAFVQKTKNGHYGVFRRLPSSERGKMQEQLDKEKSKKEKRQDADAIKRLETRSRKRYIRQLYSLSIPQMVDSKRVYPMVEKAISDGLRENLDKHIAFMMEGLK